MRLHDLHLLERTNLGTGFLAGLAKKHPFRVWAGLDVWGKLETPSLFIKKNKTLAICLSVLLLCRARPVSVFLPAIDNFVC